MLSLLLLVQFVLSSLVCSIPNTLSAPGICFVELMFCSQATLAWLEVLVTCFLCISFTVIAQTLSCVFGTEKPLMTPNAADFSALFFFVMLLSARIMGLKLMLFACRQGAWQQRFRLTT